MTEYLLQDCPKEQRFIIDEKTHPGCTTEKVTHASCWIEAKKNFGFDLTPVQKDLLDNRPS